MQEHPIETLYQQLMGDVEDIHDRVEVKIEEHPIDIETDVRDITYKKQILPNHQGAQCCGYGCKKREKSNKRGEWEEGMRSDSEGSEDEESCLKRKFPRTFHTFPDDPERRKLWLLNMCRRDWNLGQHAVLCSDHFLEKYMDRNGERTSLTDNAVPTRYKAFPKHLKKTTKEIPKSHTILVGPNTTLQLKRTLPEISEPNESLNVNIEGPSLKKNRLDHDYNQSPIKKELHRSQERIIVLKRKLKTSQQRSTRLNLKVSSLNTVVKCLKETVTHLAEQQLLPYSCEVMLFQAFSGGSSKLTSRKPSGKVSDSDNPQMCENEDSNGSSMSQDAILADTPTNITNKLARKGPNNSSGEDKPYVVRISRKGVQKRCKPVNSIKKHTENAHKKDSKVRKRYHCYCGLGYYTTKGLKNHSFSAHKDENMVSGFMDNGDVLQVPASQLTQGSTNHSSAQTTTTTGTKTSIKIFTTSKGTSVTSSASSAAVSTLTPSFESDVGVTVVAGSGQDGKGCIALATGNQEMCDRRKRNINISEQNDPTTIPNDVVRNLHEDVFFTKGNEKENEKCNDNNEDPYLRSKNENKTNYDTQDLLCELEVRGDEVNKEELYISRKITKPNHIEEIAISEIDIPSMESSFLNNILKISEHNNDFKMHNTVVSQCKNNKFIISINTTESVMHKPVNQMDSTGNATYLQIKQNKIKTYQCSQCNKMFATNFSLVNHQKIHTRKKPYKCSICDKCFYGNGDLVRHIRIHTGEKPYLCSYCGKTFPVKGRLVKHQRIHTGEKPYKCSQCNKSFSSQGNFKRHLQMHRGEKPHLCDHCGKCFTQKSTLVEHQRLHTGEKPFKCSHCGKCFTQRSYLVVHQRIHTGERPFKCIHCDKSFTQKNSLVAHKIIHTGEKKSQKHTGEKKSQKHTGEKFKCSHCDKLFSSKYYLINHKRIHTGEKPYECSHCNKHFTFESSLVVHQRIHSGEKPYICSHCGKCFAQISHLALHKRMHTGEKPYKCSHCDKSFSQQGNLTQHQRIHTGERPYKCSHCNKSFPTGSSLTKHLTIHTG